MTRVLFSKNALLVFSSATATLLKAFFMGHGDGEYVRDLSQDCFIEHESAEGKAAC